MFPSSSQWAGCCCNCSYLQTLAREQENAMTICVHLPQPGNGGVLQLPVLSGFSKVAGQCCNYSSPCLSSPSCASRLGGNVTVVSANPLVYVEQRGEFPLAPSPPAMLLDLQMPLLPTQSWHFSYYYDSLGLGVNETTCKPLKESQFLIALWNFWTSVLWFSKLNILRACLSSVDPRGQCS